MKKRKKGKDKRKEKPETERQKLAKRLILANNGSMGKALRQAGYSANYAKNPKLFKQTKAGQELIDWIDEEIEKLKIQADRTRKRAPYRDAVHAVDTLQKLKRLEGGKPTGLVEIKSLEETLREILK